jgi:hypothetical protein
MIPTARRVARQGGRRLAVLRLLNSYRGWDNNHTPVDDVRWAVDELLRRFPGRSLGLVGQSLGGRAAMLGAAAPEVAVAARNPWLHPDERPMPTRAQVLVVHGLQDRVARPPDRSRFVERLSATTRASYLALADGKHAMLRSGAASTGTPRSSLPPSSCGTRPRQRSGRVPRGPTCVKHEARGRGAPSGGRRSGTRSPEVRLVHQVLSHLAQLDVAAGRGAREELESVVLVELVALHHDADRLPDQLSGLHARV